jgi:hypothetical protein
MVGVGDASTHTKFDMTCGWRVPIEPNAGDAVNQCRLPPAPLGNRLANGLKTRMG